MEYLDLSFVEVVALDEYVRARVMQDDEGSKVLAETKIPNDQGSFRFGWCGVLILGFDLIFDFGIIINVVALKLLRLLLMIQI